MARKESSQEWLSKQIIWLKQTTWCLPLEVFKLNENAAKSCTTTLPTPGAQTECNSFKMNRKLLDTEPREESVLTLLLLFPVSSNWDKEFLTSTQLMRALITVWAIHKVLIHLHSPNISCRTLLSARLRNSQAKTCRGRSASTLLVSSATSNSLQLVASATVKVHLMDQAHLVDKVLLFQTQAS